MTGIIVLRLMLLYFCFDELIVIAQSLMNTDINSIPVAAVSGSCENCWLNSFATFKNYSLQHMVEKFLDRKTIEYKKGEYLVKSGDCLTGVYCIKKGSVKISQKGTRKKEFILWIAGAGDTVGLNSFINDDVFSFSASAREPVSTCFLPAPGLKILLNKEPQVFVQLMKKVCDKLDFVEQRIASISRKNIREQCAEILVFAAKQISSESSSETCINYTVTDLASLVGTTRDYMYKILLEFTDKKILSIQNTKIVVNDPEALAIIATENDK